jgi:hypothetical protein
MKFVVLCVSLFILAFTAACGDDADTLSIPGRLEALAIQDRLSIQLFWPAADGEPDAILIEWSSTGPEGPWSQGASITGESITWIDQSLENNVTYYYRVKARKGNEQSDYSNVASATATDLPTPPPTR